MSTEKRPVLRLIVPSSEAEVMRVLLELGKPATIKQIQERLPGQLSHQIYHQLIKLKDRYKLVTRQKVKEKRDVWRRFFLYQPTEIAEKKYQQALARAKH